LQTILLKIRMRFKTSNLRELPKHADLVSCVSWLSPDDVVSIGDDRKINKWSLVTGETALLAELPEEFHPTDMHFLPRGQSGGGGGGGLGGGSKKGGKGELRIQNTINKN
jgi:WD40 repeat protein